jgi:hypothetical protein
LDSKFLRDHNASIVLKSLCCTTLIVPPCKGRTTMPSNNFILLYISCSFPITILS